MHAEFPEEFFLNAAKLLLANPVNRDESGRFAPRSPEAAYVLGFLCHFTLDAACHPFIDSQAVDGLSHGKIESELDKRQMQRSGMPPRGYNAAVLFHKSAEARRASALVLGVDEKHTKRAMRSMKVINGAFSNDCEFLHLCCHAVLRVVGLNGSYGDSFLHKKPDPRCLTVLPVLDELLADAVPVACAAIEEYFRSLPDAVSQGALNEFYRRNYSGLREEHE